MAEENDLVAASRFLSYVLRHAPESIGVTMDGAGWVSVEELVARSADSDRPLSVSLIEQVVADNNKQRFALSEDGRRIRANQGHSVDVDLGLEQLSPPDELFHGTATRFLDAILAQGLQPGDRNHVHLSADRDTAVTVGSRHGKPVVLGVASGAMAADGLVFHRSANGVWLTASVPPRFLTVLT